jgi:hypothetical protein
VHPLKAPTRDRAPGRIRTDILALTEGALHLVSFEGMVLATTTVVAPSASLRFTLAPIVAEPRPSPFDLRRINQVARSVHRGTPPTDRDCVTTACLCPARDSNPQPTGFRPAASTVGLAGRHHVTSCRAGDSNPHCPRLERGASCQLGYHGVAPGARIELTDSTSKAWPRMPAPYPGM